MAKRVKSDKPLIPIYGGQAVDKYIKEIGTLTGQIENLQASATAKINAIKESLAVSVAQHTDQIELITKSLEAFAVNNAEWFGAKRSRKLDFGTIGWRKSSSIKTKKDTLDLIKAVFSKALAKACIIVKESVDKDALRKLTDEQLTSVNARRDGKDTFFVEPEFTEAKEKN